VKRVAIVQSSYIPWKGFFDLMASVDELVLYDDAQYTRRDWRNRNRIKTRHGVQWLTVPVHVKGRFEQAIKDTLISDSGWATRHWRTISASYARAAYFDRYAPIVQGLFSSAAGDRLSAINRHFIDGCCAILGIETRITWSMDYELASERTARLVGICRQAGATEYLSGPSARGYLDVAQFARAGIGVSFMDYSGYPSYEQLHPPFDHHVSVIDLIVNTGPEAGRYMLSPRLGGRGAA